MIRLSSICKGVRPTVRFALAACLCVSVVAGALSLTGHAQQSRAVTEGVYSAQQAVRAQMTYVNQCAVCHGNSLEGASEGPPLTGNSFLSNWSGLPLLDLVNKIHRTMPYDSPGSLDRQQAIDLAAYILQVGDFPAGQAELSEGMLAQVALPTVETSPATSPATSGGVALQPPLGNLAELMRAIAFFNSNIVFNLQQHNPDTEPPKEVDPSGSDWIQWSYTIYPGWLAVDQAAVALTETAPLLLTPGRRCQNGRIAPVDSADWKQYTAELAEVGKTIYAASKARNYDAFADIAGELSDACDNCHRVYRDNGGAEGSGENRCLAIQPSSTF